MSDPNDAPRILVISASTRQGRQADRVYAWLRPLLESHSGLAFEHVDLRDWQLPYYDDPRLPNASDKTGRVAEWAALVGAADGYLIVTPEYNRSFPAVLKSALDAVYTEWNRKPVAFVTYGGWSAGTRAGEQLRLVACELQMAPVRSQVAIQFPSLAFDDEGGLVNGANIVTSAGRMLSDLEWWTRALKTARAD